MGWAAGCCTRHNDERRKHHEKARLALKDRFIQERMRRTGIEEELTGTKKALAVATQALMQTGEDFASSEKILACTSQNLKLLHALKLPTPLPCKRTRAHRR